MDDHLQRPLWPISIILNFSKENLVKADIKQLSPKKIREILMKIEKEYKPYPYSMGRICPPTPHVLGWINQYEDMRLQTLFHFSLYNFTDIFFFLKFIIFFKTTDTTGLHIPWLCKLRWNASFFWFISTLLIFLGTMMHQYTSNCKGTHCM